MVINRKEQHSVALFGGKLLENKPISGNELYSNLIYWAHVEAPEDGVFPMHPHEGIEILTFIFEGALEHYDTATNKWTPLNRGGVQHIQSGKGVQHSEKYKKGSRAFQIWFDPNFRKALNKDPYYKDFQAESFHWEKYNGFKVMTFVSTKGPIKTDTPGISAKRYKFYPGNYTLETSKENFSSIYLLDGMLEIGDYKIGKDTFAKISSAEQIKLKVLEECNLFVLQSPISVDYKKVTD